MSTQGSDSTASTSSSNAVTAKRVQVRPWLPPPSTVAMPSAPATGSRRRAGSLTLDTAAATRSTRTPSPARVLPTSSNLRLQVLDVTCSAVALSVFTPAHPTLTARSAKPPSISILLDRRPWPHVAHAGSAPTTSVEGTGAGSLETTVIVYGLDPNREYEIGLEVLDGTNAGTHTGDDDDCSSRVTGGGDGSETMAANTGEGSTSSRRPSLESAPGAGGESTEDSSASSYPSQSNAPDGPPPPYSPSPVSTIPPVPVPISTTVTTASSLASPSSATLSGTDAHHDPATDLSETSLRNALKSLRSSSKRNEQALLATLSSLKKTVEKAAKEDQRARSRIVALEEAIRKAGEAERDVRGREKEQVEHRLREAEEEEEQVANSLGEWKEGKREVPQPDEERRNSATAVVAEDSVPASGEPPTPVTAGPSNLAELAKELDALNKAIEAVEREKEEKAGEVLKALEREMTVVEGELIQLDREDAQRAAYGPLPGSMMPILPVHAGMAPVVPMPAVPSQASSGGGPFNFRWRRGQTGAAVQQQQQQQAAAQDPRSFGRFFRRNNSNTPSAIVAPASAPPVPHLALDGSTTNSTASSSSAASSSLNLGLTSTAISSLLPTELVPSQVHLQPLNPNPSERFAAQQQFAQAHQAQALWAQAQARSGNTLSPSSPIGAAGGGGRRRAGSLNSVHNSHGGSYIGYGQPGSNSSSPSLAPAQVHTSGVQSARTSIDASNPDRSSFSLFEKEPPTTGAATTGSSPLGSGNGLKSARSRSDSTLGGGGAESIKSVESNASTTGSKEKGSKNWARLGTWSQVVGRGAKKGQSTATEEQNEAEDDHDEGREE
ncbi:uncharacterized protein JCM15063_000865 [Sporobolomyces koalae]|uniref:uncharacterized protein n=1 Tax=Sporobolomyces koalae TaxID=500713 RepID=UPI0031759E23